MNRHERRKHEAQMKKLGRQAARHLMKRMTPAGRAMVSEMTREQRRAFLEVSFQSDTPEGSPDSGVPEV